MSLLFREPAPPDAAHADWSPDGSQLAFQAGVDRSWDIWVANADGSNAEVLVDCVASCIEYDAPAWSPDGRSIAFSRIDETDDGFPAYVEVMDIATGQITTVAEVPSGDWATTPRWSPDGRFIAVTYEHFENAFQPNERKVSTTIGIVDTDEPGQVRLLADLPEWSWYPDWHPSRDEIVFTGGSERWLDHQGAASNLYSVRPDGTGLTQLTRFTVNEDWVAMPAWTRAGSSILVTLIRPTGRLRLGTVAPDGSNVGPLVPYISGAHARETTVAK